MLNFFSSEETVVPNGYIYTSHTGAKYVFLEGIWFNESNMMLVDPQKYPNMYMSARGQIDEHNNSPHNEFKIGKTYIKENLECTYIGNHKFNSEKGIIYENVHLTELMADDQRVYNVSKETLQKEWNELQFYILPPHNEDISIPAGMEIQGYKFIPNCRRFVDMKTGKAVEPATARKLTDVGMRIAREQADQNKLIPIKSALIQGDVRSEWNGTDFCDNDGNIVIPSNQSQRIFNAYQQFVNANPQDFPTLTANSNKEQGFGKAQPPEATTTNTVDKPQAVHEADESTSEPGDSNSTGNVPNGIRITSNKGKTYQKQNNQWFDVETKKPLNSSAAKGVEQAAKRNIEVHNADPKNIKIGSTVKSKSGKVYTYIGYDRFISTDGKLMPKHAAQNLIDRHKQQQEQPADGQGEPEVSPQPQGEPEAKPAEPTQGDSAPTSSPEGDGGSNDPMKSLADKIKASPYARNIKVLLTRGDKVSLLAADIFLSGKRDEVIQILKSLNNNDE